IPRPPNAFLCFRSRFIRDQKALAASKGSKSSGMQDISRQAGHIWNDMSDEERSPYVEMANRMKEEHRMAHPDYKFAP
ncbi:high mobility group box domain-containing protein, partial [Mycena epipterygia]